MSRVIKVALVAAVLLLVGCSDDADDSPTPDEGAEITLADPLPLDQLERFGGVATMNAGSNCTGTLPHRHGRDRRTGVRADQRALCG